MKTENFVFNGKGAEYFRARTSGLRTFNDVVTWFQREQGVRSKGKAIALARLAAPEKYNAFHAAAHRQTLAAHSAR